MSVVKYSLMRRHRIFIQIPLALALLGVASRAEGCYFYLFLSLLALLRINRAISGFWRAAPSQLLIGYASLLALQAMVEMPNWSLITIWNQRADLLMPLNLVLAYWVGRTALCRDLRPPDWLLWLGSAVLVSTTLTALAARGLSASSLRPTENLYVIGVLLLIVWFQSLAGNLGRINWLSAIILMTSFAPLAIFRGILSLFAFILLAFTIAWPCLVDLYVRYKVLIILGSGVIAASLMSVNKATLFRYSIYPFVSSTPFNGRIGLFREASCLLRFEALPILGEISGLDSGFWAHNLYLDSLFRHGLLPALFLLAFVVALSLNFWHASWVIVLPAGLLLLGSMLQPVEFADGIAFQLSFLVLGLLIALASQRHG